MTARQVGVALSLERERVRQIEDAAIDVMAVRMGCTREDVIAHLYAMQFEEHGPLHLIPTADPPLDETWVRRYGGTHMARLAQ